jgi:hypothetical protein
VVLARLKVRPFLIGGYLWKRGIHGPHWRLFVEERNSGSGGRGGGGGCAPQ